MIKRVVIYAILCLLSFFGGRHIVLSHTIIPPPPPKVEKCSSNNISIKPLEVKTLEIKQKEPNLREFIKSYNITDKALIAQIIKAVNEESKRFDIPKKVLVGLIATESSFDPTAMSDKHCIGLSQINGKIWLKELKEVNIVKTKTELFHPAKNIKAGAYILKYYLEEGKRKGRTNLLTYALNRYNGDTSGEYSKTVFQNIKEFENS